MLTPRPRLTPQRKSPQAPIIPTTNTRRNPYTTGQPPPQAQGGMATGMSVQPPPQRPVNHAGSLPPGFGMPPAPPTTPPAQLPNIQVTGDPRAANGQVPSVYQPIVAGDRARVSQANGDTSTSEQDAYDKAIQELLTQGPRNTSADEAQIEQMLQRTVGQGQADLNARLGAAGFGTSGALGAQSADMRSQAASAAANDIMGVRNDARQQWLDQLRTGIGAEQTNRDQNIKEDAYTRYLDALEQSLKDNGSGTADPNAAPGTDSTHPYGGNGPDTLDPSGSQYDNRPNAAGAVPSDGNGGGRHDMNTEENPNDYTEKSDGINPLFDHYEGSDGEWDYYVSSWDGKKWKVHR